MESSARVRGGGSCQQAVKEPFQLAGSNWMLQFADRFGLNLPHSFAGDFEDPSDFFEGIRVSVAKSVPQLDDFPFAVGQRLEDMIDLVLKHFLSRRVDRTVGGIVFDEVAEVAVFAFSDRSIKTDRMS